MEISPTIIVIAAAAVAVVILIVGVISVRSEKDMIEQRLASFEQSTPVFLELDIKPEDDLEKETLKDRIDKSLAQRPFGRKWRQALSRADLKITVAEFMALHVITVIGMFLLSWFVLWPQQLVMGVVAGFVGFFIPRIIVARMTANRLIKFENQLPDTLSLWVNALRSGYSVLQSMEAISRDAPDPTATEFRRVVQEVQLGIDMEDAFEHLLQRMDSEDLDLIVTAVNIQREVGGNLAEILEVIGHTIRERIKLKGEIRVLTAQGRITGYLISFLPIGLALFLNAINPTYVGLLFENRTCGWPMLAMGLVLIGIGSAIIQKIVDIKI
ncbi:MAG: type II secretion system F family protein [Chloroflexota bacterium]|nr:MAG: secretion system protein [Chloroflexota bacterium]